MHWFISGVRVVPARTNLGRLPAAGRHPKVHTTCATHYVLTSILSFTTYLLLNQLILGGGFLFHHSTLDFQFSFNLFPYFLVILYIGTFSWNSCNCCWSYCWWSCSSIMYGWWEVWVAGASCIMPCSPSSSCRLPRIRQKDVKRNNRINYRANTTMPSFPLRHPSHYW